MIRYVDCDIEEEHAYEDDNRIESIRTMRSEGLSEYGVYGRFQGGRQVRFQSRIIFDLFMADSFFFRDVGASSSSARGRSSFIRVFFFCISANVDCHFFDYGCDVLDMGIRLANFLAIGVIDDIRILRFTDRLDLGF